MKKQRCVPKIKRSSFMSLDIIKKYHTEDEVAKFCSFMTGQTCPILPNGEPGVYRWDYERWLEQGMKSKQGSDWD